MKKNWGSAVSIVILLGGMASGCGKLNDQQQQDVANIVGGLGSKNSSSGTFLSEPNGKAGLEPNFVGLINQQIDGALWLSKFKLEAVERNGLTADTAEGIAPFTTCTGSGTITAGASTCVTSCPTTSSLKIACSTTGSNSNTCNGAVYTFNNQNFAVTIDVTNVTGTGTGATGNLGLALSFSADVTGGNLTGKTMACSIGLTFDTAKVKATTPQKPALDCTNFSCTYDGKNVECAKLQADFASNMSCS